MAGSLMDFGEVARTAIGFQNLQQNIRQNDIMEQNSLARMGQLDVDRQKADLDKQKIKQDMVFRSFDELDKLKKSPAYASNVGAQVDLIHTQVGLLKHGLGVDIPMPSKQELLGSMDDYGALLRAVRSGTPEERRDATDRLMVSAPDFGSRVLKELKDANELDTQGEEMRLKLEMNKAKLTQLNLRSGQYKLQQNLYTEHIGALNETTSLPMSPEMREHFAKVMSFEKPEARQAYINMHKDVFAGFQEALGDRDFKLQGTLLQLNGDVRARADALGKAQERDGVAPAELAQELTGYESVQHARQVESEWLKDPFNKDKWKALKTAQQDVRILYGETGKKLQGVEDERLSFMNKKFDVVQQEKQATTFAQEKNLEFLQAGHDDNTAGSLAIKAAQAKFPGVAIDTGAIKNLNKVGKQSIELGMSKDDNSRQFKAIEGAQSVIDYVSDLDEAIAANPKIVGKGAVAGTAIAGSLQQLRAIAGFDPGAAKFLNTSTRDKAEALYEILVYAQARSMDPAGALDIKVVEHARKVLGDMNSLTTGPQQMRNKLATIKANAERNMRHARRRLKEGQKAYLTDETNGSEASMKNPAEMSQNELAQELLKVLNGE